MAKEGKLMIYTPQFERPEEWPKPDYPTNTEAFLFAINNFNEQQLAGIGFSRWEQESELMLIPGQCYDFIPDGLEIIFISGRKDIFKSGETDNDIRFGCLPFGIIPKTK